MRKSYRWFRIREDNDDKLSYTERRFKEFVNLPKEGKYKNRVLDLSLDIFNMNLDDSEVEKTKRFIVVKFPVKKRGARK